MKWIDRLSYSLLGAIVGAVGFLLGNAVFYKAAWQLLAAPIGGGILGLVAAASVLRDMKRPSLPRREKSKFVGRTMTASTASSLGR